MPMQEENLLSRILSLAVEIQQVPAPTFHEAQRAAFLHQRFQAEGLEDVETDPLGNVYARLPGTESRRPVVVSAHSDTVFPKETDLSVRRENGLIYGPGIGDNSLGVAGLFGLVWALREGSIELPGDLWLVANVGEEGLGDLCGMKAVVDRFNSQPLAYLVLEGMALGQVYYHGLEVRRYRITVQTLGGHSWVDYGRPSAIHELAKLVVRITGLELPKTPRTTLNVGVISGGTSINTVAARASLELDLRSEDGVVLQGLVDKVHRFVQDANQGDVRVNAELIGQRPSGKISLQHPLLRLALRTLESQGFQPRYNVGSTDANIPLSRGLPAICIGLTNGGGAHTVDEYIQTAGLEKGMKQLLMLVEGAYKELS
jgi:tripeptide aminopeptidase